MELEQLEFKAEFPNSIIALLKGQLGTKVVHVQRWRIIKNLGWCWASIQPQTPHMQSHIVCWPNALRHIDGSHHLIGGLWFIGVWLVSHKLLLRCVNNNLPKTFGFSVEAMSQWCSITYTLSWWWKCTCGDLWKYDVKDIVYIAGITTQCMNKQLWRDAYCVVTSNFDIFRTLELSDIWIITETTHPKFQSAEKVETLHHLTCGFSVYYPDTV